MDAVECTHCQVTMTSWSAPGSTVRYYQCPFCQRTHASCYGEVFQRGAGARKVNAPEHMARPSTLPQASEGDIQWAGVKARAARWFARLEAEEHQASARRPRGAPPAQALPRAEVVSVASARPARHR